MDLLPGPRRSRRWLFSLCVLAAFTVFSVGALAMPRTDSARSLAKAYTDLASERGAPDHGRLVVADGEERSVVGSDRTGYGHGFGDHVTNLFIHKATVCMVGQSQADLLQQVFFVTWKTVKIDGVDTQVMMIRGVKNPWLLKKLIATIGHLDCKVVNLHVAWLVFVFNPHLS